MMHPLLQNQLIKYFGSLDAIPDDLKVLLEEVSDSYKKFDNDLVQSISPSGLPGGDNRFRQIFNHTYDAVLIFDPTNGKVLDANARASELLGHSLQALMNIPISTIYPGQEQTFSIFTESVLQAGSGRSKDFTCTTSEKIIVPVEISAAAVQSGTQIHIISLLRDISAQAHYEEELEEQWSFLRQVIDSNPSLIFVKDKDRRYSLVNRAMAQELNAPLHQITGKTNSDLGIDEEMQMAFAQQDSIVFETGQEFRSPGELIINPDGSHSWQETIKRPIYNKEGNVAGVLGMVNDITPHKNAEENLQQRNQALETLNQLSRRVLETRSLDQILATIAKAIVETLNVTSVYISDWNPLTGMATVLAEHIAPDAALFESDPSVGQQYNLPEGFEDTYKWIQNPVEPLITHLDDPDLSPQERAYKESNNIFSTISFAIQQDDKVIGYIELYNSRQKHVFTEDEIEFLQTMTYQISAAINNTQLIESLQNSEGRFRTILDSMPFGVTIIDKTSHILTANNAALTMMGYEKVEDIQGHVCHDTMCPAQKGKCPILDLNQQVDRAERVLVTKEGGTLPILKSVIQIDYDGEEVLLESFIDISEQKRLADERQVTFERRGQHVAVANEISQEIATAQDMGELYQNVVSILQEKLDYDYVQVLRFNIASDTLFHAAGASKDGEYALQSGYQVMMGDGTIGRAGTTSNSVLLTDTALEPTWTPLPGLEDIKSELSTPIILGDDLLGVLNAQSRQVDAVNEDVQILFEILAGQIAVAVESFRLRADMEERFRELTALQKLAVSESAPEFDTDLAKKAYTFDLTELEVNETELEELTQQTESIFLPMELRGEQIGMISIEEDEEKPLSEDEKTLLHSITNEVAEALERARLFEATQRSAAELTVLNEMGNAFTETLSVDSIIDNIYTYGEQLMDLPQFFVALYEEESSMVSFPLVFKNGERITASHPEWPFWETRPLEEGGLSGHIIHNRQPILIENNAEDVLTGLNIPYRTDGKLTQSLLGVPLAIGDRVLGLIITQSEEVDGLYSQHHLDLLSAIASQAAIAIDNARLFIQEQARAEQERLVRTITDKVRRGTDAKQIMRITLEELSSAFDAEESVLRLGTKDQLISASKKNDRNGDNDAS